MQKDARGPAGLGSNKYSERLGVLDADQLQAVADEFGLGRVIDAEPAPGGLFGQIVFLTTTGGRYAMRGNPHGHAQLIKERFVARLIHQRSSLPAPWPYRVSENTERFGWTYSVMPRLPGTSGSQQWEIGDDRRRIALATAFGEALTRLHETTVPFCGPFDARIEDFSPIDDFPAWALDRLDQVRDACRAVDGLTAEAERLIDTVIEESSDALAVPFRPVLVHHDFTLGNVNFKESGQGFTATGVFDLFESYYGDGEEDLVRILLHVATGEQRRAFASAYTARRPLRPGAAQRLVLYALADFLVAWEYGKRNRVWFEDANFEDRVAPILANARAIGSMTT